MSVLFLVFVFIFCLDLYLPASLSFLCIVTQILSLSLSIHTEELYYFFFSPCFTLLLSFILVLPFYL